MCEPGPLAPDRFPDLPPLTGVRLGAASCGIKYSNRTDLGLIVFDPPATVAGVFTRSQTAAAPVEWCQAQLPRGRVAAILANSGNANAFTGVAGWDAVQRTAAQMAEVAGCAKEQVYLASTGVIGEPLPDGKITEALAGLYARATPDGWSAVADAIMTTDLFAKGATRQAEIGGKLVTLNGIAKGSGMIAPDMGTMLAFVVTDASLPAPLLQRLLVRANDNSFNAITVDGDTSTSDTVLLAATGGAGTPRVTHAADPRLRGFRRALEALMVDLAQQIVRDGEGASKFVTVTVSGAASARAAKRIGLAIGNSPLVKTAIAGEDANWGRIVMAVGKAGEKANRDKLKIRIGGTVVADKGMRAPDYDENPVAVHMQGQKINIEVDVGVGKGRATIWTCDLTHRYISINADYRT